MDLDIRYAAGLFDGEGWITLNRRVKPNSDHIQYQLFVGVGMVYKPIIEALQSSFGGNIFIKKTSPAQSERTRTGFLWTASSNPAEEFLTKVVPFLIVKREEAELAIEFQQHMRHHRQAHTLRYRPELREEFMAYREGVYHQLRALKRREFFTPVDGDPIPDAA